MESATLVSISPSNIQINTIESEAEWDALELAWNALMERCHYASVFLTWDWLRPWWRAYKKETDRLFIVTVRREGQLVGIAPLYRRSVHWMGVRPLQRLGFIGDCSGDSEYLDFIYDDTCGDMAVRQILEYLFSNEIAWHIADFHLIREDSPSIEPLRHVLAQRRCHHSWQSAPCLAIALPKEWTEYLRRLQRRKNQTVRSHLKRIHGNSSLRVERCADADTLPYVLSSLFRLHQQRWAAVSQFGAFTDKARRRFYKEMTLRFLKKDQLRLYSLLIDDEPVAHEISFEFNKTLYALQQAYNPAFRHQAVSNMLRATVLQDCIENGLEVYDFLGGDEAYKKRWGASQVMAVNVLIARPGWKGETYVNLPRMAASVKERFKEQTPDTVLDLKRQAVDTVQKKWFHLIQFLKPDDF